MSAPTLFGLLDAYRRAYAAADKAVKETDATTAGPEKDAAWKWQCQACDLEESAVTAICAYWPTEAEREARSAFLKKRFGPERYEIQPEQIAALIDAKPPPSQIMVLFEQWHAALLAVDEAGKGDDEAKLDAAMSRCNDLHRQLAVLPATDAMGFAIKITTITQYGDYMDLAGFVGSADLVREAAASVGHPEQAELRLRVQS